MLLASHDAPRRCCTPGCFEGGLLSCASTALYIIYISKSVCVYIYIYIYIYFFFYTHLQRQHKLATGCVHIAQQSGRMHGGASSPEIDVSDSPAASTTMNKHVFSLIH